MEYFIGKLLTYDVIEYATGRTECNYAGEYYPETLTQKVLVNVQNVAGAPTEEEAKRLTLEFFNKFYPGFEEEATMENFKDKLDLPNNGYTLTIDKVFVKDFKEVLGI